MGPEPRGRRRSVAADDRGAVAILVLGGLSPGRRRVILRSFATEWRPARPPKHAVLGARPFATPQHVVDIT